MADNNTTAKTPRELKLEKFSYSTIKNNMLGQKADTTEANRRLFDVRNYYNFRSVKENTNNSARCISKSFLCSEGDFNYSEHLTSYYNIDEKSGKGVIVKPSIATLIINEFQPFQAWYGLAKLATGAWHSITQMSDLANAINQVGQLAIAEQSPNFKNALLQIASSNPSSIYANINSARKR